jgi:hypothetical protein
VREDENEKDEKKGRREGVYSRHVTRKTRPVYTHLSDISRNTNHPGRSDGQVEGGRVRMEKTSVIIDVCDLSGSSCHVFRRVSLKLPVLIFVGLSHSGLSSCAFLKQCQ